MIAVICAMHEERDALLTKMSDVKENHLRPLVYHNRTMDDLFYSGKIGEKEVTLFHSGVGKVYSAITTALVIEHLQPELIINLGCAGSLNENIHVNDVVVATRAAHWDCDVPGWPRDINSEKVSFSCDERCAQLALEIEAPVRICAGPIVSSDSFIYRKEQVEEIKKYFPEALCGEMEGASIANTCDAFNVRCAIIRSISDETLVNGDYENFDFNLLRVCETAANICVELIIRN